MLLSDLDVAAPSEVIRLAGLREGRAGSGGVYAAPCPLPGCGAERAHTRANGGADKRLAVLVRNKGAVTCCACGVSMSRGDFVALARFGVRWAGLTREQRAVMLEAPAPPVAPPVEPPKRLDQETWRRLLWATIPARQDRECAAWAMRRGLRFPSDARAIVGAPDEGLPLWTTGERRLWLPDLGARLLLPCFDGQGNPRGARIRDVRGGKIKERALQGYDATGLLYVPRALRDLWREDREPDRVVAFVEGGPDRLAGGWAWRGQAHVCGLFNGSWGAGCDWSGVRRRGPAPVLVYQEDAPDQHGKRAGQEYARRLAVAIPGLRVVGVSKLFAAAGVSWTEGEDLADLARRGTIPPWEVVEGLAVEGVAL